MKKIIIMACVVLGLSASAKNITVPDTGSPATYNEVINSYIDSYMSSNYKKLDNVLGDEANIKIPRAQQVLVHSKNNLVAQMKKESGTKQNCNFNYEVLDKSDAIVIAKVNFTYNDFTQHNYLVLEKNENKEWKITQICKIFEDVKQTPAAGGNVTASN